MGVGKCDITGKKLIFKEQVMNNKWYKQICLLLLIILILSMVIYDVRANYNFEREPVDGQREVEKLLQVDDLLKYTSPSLDNILSREIVEIEEDGVKAVVEDIRTDTHRIIITRTDSGSSVFVEDVASGMGYQVEGDVVTDVIDLNEIRNTIIRWEMPEEDQKAFEEYEKRMLEDGEKWNESTLSLDLKGEYTIEENEEGVIIEPTSN